MYKHVGEAWQKLWKERPESIRDRTLAWKKEPAIVRVERPLRIDKARRFGYKAKQGFIVVRVRVGRSGGRRQRPKGGRRPKHLGVVKIKKRISRMEIAELRVARKFPNLKVLNTYFLYRDGKYAWYECLLVDPNHPVVKRDAELMKRLGVAVPTATVRA